MNCESNLDFKKLKTIRKGLSKSIKDLRVIRRELIFIDSGNLNIGLVNSLKLSIIQIKEEISDYMSSVLDSSSVAVSKDYNFNESMNRCMELGFLPVIDKTAITLLVSYRDASCHRSEEPSDKALLNFIDTNFCDIEKLIFFMDKVIRSGRPLNTTEQPMQSSSKF